MLKQRNIVGEQFLLTQMMPVFCHSMLILFGKRIKMLSVLKLILIRLSKVIPMTGIRQSSF